MISKTIFREYDIRGIYNKDLFDEDGYSIGLAVGTTLMQKKENEIIVGYDNRKSSPKLINKLIKGLTDTGINVTNIGLATTPMVYFGRYKLKINPSIIVTASHNPKEYNGFKISYNGKNNCYGEEIQKLYNIIINNEIEFNDNKGEVKNIDISDDYSNFLIKDINIDNNKLKVIYDCGNGTTSIIADKVFSKLNINIKGIFNNSDPEFPNHHPDPNIEDNLSLLKQEVIKNNADIGFGFDGDGDRVGVIDNEGNFISIEKLMIIIWRDIYKKVKTKKGLFDVKCSKILEEELIKLGIKPIEGKTGTSYLQTNSFKYNIEFAGEYSGHTIFRDRFPGFEDAIYTALRIIEILSKNNLKIKDLLIGINTYYNTETLNFETTEEQKFMIIDKVYEYCQNKGYNISTIDGVKVIWDYGTALIRSSNTSPNITYRYEATSKEKLHEIENEFNNLLVKLKKEVK